MLDPITEDLDCTLIQNYFSAEYHVERSKGAHLMQVISHLEGSLGLVKRSEEFEPFLDSFAVMGFLWEHEISAAIEAAQRFGDAPANVVSMWEWMLGRRMTQIDVERRKELIRPGEQYEDGLYCTPDGVNIRYRCLEEWKCVWKSARWQTEDFADKFWRFTVQAACYCYVLGLNEARFRIFHLNGSYEKGKMGFPVLRGVRLLFTEEQLEETWSMVVTHSIQMRKQGLLPKLNPKHLSVA